MKLIMQALMGIKVDWCSGIPWWLHKVRKSNLITELLKMKGAERFSRDGLLAGVL